MKVWQNFIRIETENVDFTETGNNISDLFLVQSDLTSCSNSLTQQFDALHLLVGDDYDEDVQHATHPLAFSARANADDNPTLDEAMQSPD